MRNGRAGGLGGHEERKAEFTELAEFTTIQKCQNSKSSQK